MIGGRNVFDQPVKNNLATYDNIRKIPTGQGDDYTTGCLLDYPYFKNLIYPYFKNWSKSNTANKSYCKTRVEWRYNNVFHYWRNKRNHFRCFKTNFESIVNVLYLSIISV